MNFVTRKKAHPSFENGRLSLWLNGLPESVIVTIRAEGIEGSLTMDQFTVREEEGKYQKLSAGLDQFGLVSGSKVDRIALQYIGETSSPICIANIYLGEPRVAGFGTTDTFGQL
eukprot:TRINITY_DN31294_c0_g1_i3.p3 TRINITY_DN31294_c0_g1~~TRINITY_DN31294_c0_g1_i3.p3  ORF type:complete len:114 (-),score=6.79 TRINITY_DN31294_c0_g1_i3:263-604(-)